MSDKVVAVFIEYSVYSNNGKASLPPSNVIFVNIKYTIKIQSVYLRIKPIWVKNYLRLIVI